MQKSVRRPGMDMPLVLGLIAIAGLLFASSFFIRNADNLKPKEWQKEEMTYLPSGKYLKPMTLGYPEAAASLLWVKGVLYFGEAFLTDGNHQWMGHILDIVTTLNPRFREAYNFGATMLTKDSTEIPRTLKLIDRGLEQYPEEWQWRVSAALARQKLDSNLVAAAVYLQPLGQDTVAPKHVRTLAATFLEKGGDEKMAISYLVGQYAQAASPYQCEIFADRLARIGLKTASTADSIRLTPEYRLRLRQTTAILKQVQSRPKTETLAIALLNEILTGEISPPTHALLRQLGAE